MPGLLPTSICLWEVTVCISFSRYMLNFCCLHNFSGKIKYSTEPPENYIRAAYLSTKIITDMNQEFDIGALIAEEKSSLEGKNQLVISFYV